MTEGYCEECSSRKGHTIYCKGGCGIEGCMEPKYFSCKDCGHMTSFYHITAKGKEVLEILLEPESSEEERKNEKT